MERVILYDAADRLIMKSKIRMACSRAKYAAIGAAVGAGLGGLLSRNAASTGGALGGLVGATLGEISAGEWNAPKKITEKIQRE